MNLQEQISRIQSMMGVINEDSDSKEIIFDIVDYNTKGIDLYEYKSYENELWLILTNNKEWVVNLTVGVLFFNPEFFKECFKYLSLDPFKHQSEIKEWALNTIQNGVQQNISNGNINEPNDFEDMFKRGVQLMFQNPYVRQKDVDNIIENGTRYTINNN